MYAMVIRDHSRSGFSRVALIGASAVGLVVAGITAYALLRPHPAIPPESILPSGSPIIFTIDTQTIWRDLRTVVKNDPQLSKGFERLEKDAGFNPEDDFFSWAGKGVVTADVSVLLFIPQVTFVGAVQALDRNAAIRSLEKLASAISKSFAQELQHERYKGYEISFIPAQPPRPGFATALIADCAVFASGNDLMRKVVDVRETGKASLEKSDSWKMVESSLPRTRALSLSADFTSLSARFPVPPATPEASNLLESLKSAGWYMLAISPEKDRVRIDAQLSGGKTIVANLREAMGGADDVLTESTLRRLPSDTVGLVTVKNMASVYKFVRSTMNQAAGMMGSASASSPASEFDDALRRAEQSLGLSIEHDLVGWLTGEITFAVSSLGSPIPQIVAQFQGPDEATVRGKVQLIRQAITKKKFDVKFVPDPSVGEGVERLQFSKGVPPDQGPWISIRGDTFVFALGKDAMKEVLSVEGGANASLAQSPGYTSLRGSLPKRLSSIIYVDFHGALEHVANQYGALAPAGMKEAADRLKGSSGIMIGIASSEDGLQSTGVIGAPLATLFDAAATCPEVVGGVTLGAVALSAIPAPGALGATTSASIGAAVLAPVFLKARAKAQQVSPH